MSGSLIMCCVLLYGVRVFVCCACVYEHVCVPCLCFEFGALMYVCFVFVIHCVMLYDVVLCCLCVCVCLCVICVCLVCELL